MSRNRGVIVGYRLYISVWNWQLRMSCDDESWGSFKPSTTRRFHFYSILYDSYVLCMFLIETGDINKKERGVAF